MVTMMNFRYTYTKNHQRGRYNGDNHMARALKSRLNADENEPNQTLNPKTLNPKPLNPKIAQNADENEPNQTLNPKP